MNRVSTELLQGLAGPAPQPTVKSHTNNGKHNGSAKFDLKAWISSHGLDATGPEKWASKSGTADMWIINPCPWNNDHSNNSAWVAQFPSGAIDAGCHHAGCAGRNWHDLRDIYEPGWRERDNWNQSTPNHDAGNGKANGRQAPPGDEELSREIMPTPLTIRQLVKAHPVMRPVLIGGVLRLGEIANIIAQSKMGKTWLVYLIAVCVATGRAIFGRFPIERAGKVLIIDNELHGETIANRIPKVLASMGIMMDELGDRLQIVSLRGKLKDIHALGRFFRTLTPGEWSLIIIDAWYRVLPAGIDENKNADVASIFNLQDSFAEYLQCSIVNIHHGSKGGQADKAVTDVGIAESGHCCGSRGLRSIASGCIVYGRKRG